MDGVKNKISLNKIRRKLKILKNTNRLLFVIVSWWMFLFLFTGCGKKQSLSAFIPGDTLQLQYAKNLSIVRYDGYTKVVLRNPWDTIHALHTYLLVPSGSLLPEALPEGTVVRVPLRNALVYSSVHCGLLEELGTADAIGGVCDLSYIRLPYILERYEKNTLTDAGSSMNPNIEQIIDMHPDGILLSPFENSGGYGAVEKLDIPLIECADYMENTALGRAEWMYFYGLLFGKETEADSLFTCIKQAYSTLSDSVKTSGLPRPSVICELKSTSAWYVPGGNSTTARLISDAGADYVFGYIPQSGAVSLSFETVLDKGRQADFWLIKYNQKVDKTYAGLASDYAPYTRFSAFAKHRIYGCNTAYVPFYEESPFHPELQLKDLIKIFHPDLLKDYKLRYYSPLKEE